MIKNMCGCFIGSTKIKNNFESDGLDFLWILVNIKDFKRILKIICIVVHSETESQSESSLNLL